MIVPSKEDIEPFAKFEISDFERWLRIGFEGFLLENEGTAAFDHLGVFIGLDDHLVQDLRNIYHVFPARSQAHIRQAVANLLASLEPIERNIIIFEHLLLLASVLPAGAEVLRVLPARIGNGFFGLTENRECISLFDLTLMTVIELTVPKKDSIDCLHALISSKYFENAYAGIALTALCRADDQNLAKHMAYLRESLAAMFREFNTNDITKRQLAAKILSAVGRHRLVMAIPELLLSDCSYRKPVNDNWFIYALLERSEEVKPLLSRTENKKGEIYFYRPDKPAIKDLLLDKTHRIARKKHKDKPYLDQGTPDQGTPMAIFDEIFGKLPSQSDIKEMWQ